MPGGVCAALPRAGLRARSPPPPHCTHHPPPPPPMQRGPPGGQGWPWGLEKHGNRRAAGPWAQAPAPPRPLPGGRRRVSPAQRLQGKAGWPRPRSEKTVLISPEDGGNVNPPRPPSAPPRAAARPRPALQPLRGRGRAREAGAVGAAGRGRGRWKEPLT